LFKDKIQPSKTRFLNEDLSNELDSDALIPQDYIKSETERFFYYKKLYNIRENDELQALVEELTDRFGKLPKNANELIFAVRLRVLALYSGLARISLKKGKLTAEFPPDTNSDFYETLFQPILELMNEFPDARLNQDKKRLMIEIPVESRDKAIEILWRLRKIVEMVLDNPE
jgi:transcription-repair coupling factor (superfamily II helicase)